MFYLFKFRKQALSNESFFIALQPMRCRNAGQTNGAQAILSTSQQTQLVVRKHWLPQWPINEKNESGAVL